MLPLHSRLSLIEMLPLTDCTNSKRGQEIKERQAQRLTQGYPKSRRQVVRATTFCTVASSVWNLLHVTLQASRILSGFYIFWKTYVLLYKRI